MKYLILAILTALVLSGCSTINPAASALLNSAGQDYTGARANIQQADDMKLHVWLDSACAINIGALQRAISTSGNPSIANAIFTACPVPAVGVTSTSATGSMQVQTFNLPPLVRDSTGAISSSVPVAQPPAAAPAIAPTVTPAPISALKPVVKKATPLSSIAPMPIPSPALVVPQNTIPTQPIPILQKPQEFPPTPPQPLPSILPGGLPGQ